MDNNNPTPLQPQPINQQPAPVIKNDKSLTKNVSLIIGLCLGLVVLAGVGALAFQQNNNSKKASQDNTGLKTANEKLLSDNQMLTSELEKRMGTTGEENIDKNLFQSVFLKNGQTYFGKITKLTETQLTLENIYYLKTSKSGVNTDKMTSDVSLVKLGSELHGPEDKMFIERKEVTFWENLKADGQVAKAIAQYEKQNPFGQR